MIDRAWRRAGAGLPALALGLALATGCGPDAAEPAAGGYDIGRPSSTTAPDSPGRPPTAHTPNALADSLGDVPADARLAFLQHHLQGLELARTSQFGRALAEFDRCVELYADHAPTRFQRGRLLWHAGEQDAALAEFDAALAADPGHAPTHAFLLGLAKSDADVTDRDAAREHRQALAAQLGELFDFERKLAAERFRGGADPYPEIRELANADPDLRSDDPLTVLAHAVKSRAMRNGNYRPLLSDQLYRRVFDGHPTLVALRLDHADRLVSRGVRFPLEGEPGQPPMTSSITLDRAQSYYEQVLDVVPLDSQAAQAARIGLADVALRMGDWDEAIRGYAAVLELPGVDEADRNKALLLAGTAAFRKGDRREAERWLRTRLELGRDLTAAWILNLITGTELELREETADPALLESLRFVDVAHELGVDKYDGAGPSAWGDYDRDGDLDLFVAGCDTFAALYRFDGEAFTDVSREAGLLDVPSGFSATFADYDEDGFVDLYIGRNGWSGAAPNSLFHNEGDGTFVDVTEVAGVGHDGSTFTHAWSDLDRDGRLDLVLANGITGDGSTNTVYRNLGDGTFEDVTEAWGLAEEVGTRTIGVAVGDYDEDGWPDVFYNSWETRNRLYRNLGRDTDAGRFEEVAVAAGVDGSSHGHAGYVAFFVDVDNDGRLDVISTKLSGFKDVVRGQLAGETLDAKALMLSTKLYRNLGDGTFADVSVAAGFVRPHGTMGANVADVNNDGFVDLYLGTGDPRIERLEPNAFYANTGGGFVELTRWTGLGHVGKGHGITFADFDFDGDLDVYAPQGGFEHGDLWHNALYRNEAGNHQHWLALLPEGVESNGMGVGARLTLTAGDMTQTREVTAGGAFGSSSTPWVHFGLGAHDAIDALEVVWPSGVTSRYEGVPVDRHLRLREGAAELEPFERPR